MITVSEAKEKAETMARAVFDKLGMDEKADTNIFKLVIGVFITAILVGALIPTAINSIIAGRNASVNGTWDAGTSATYNALPILVVIVIVAVLAGLAYRSFND